MFYEQTGHTPQPHMNFISVVYSQEHVREQTLKCTNEIKLLTAL